MMAEELALDLGELKMIQSIAKRSRVVNFIGSEISSLEKSLQLSKESASVPTAPAPTPAPAPAPVSTSVKPVTQALTYVSLGSFSWDQDTDKIKIYIFLEGVDQDKVVTEFKPMSFDIKMHDVQGKNYRYGVPKLSKQIVPEKCKVVVKPKRVIVTLVKRSVGNWQDLRYKEDKVLMQRKPNLEKEKNPMAGIMDLMKNMYEEGDENMKKTIAKAWTDARSGKTADSLKGL